MKKISIVAFVLALIFCVTAFFGHDDYQIYSFKSKAEPILKDATLRTTSMLNYSLGKSSITYNELFDTGETSIKEIESNKLVLQSETNKYNEKESIAAISYLNACQDLLRAQISHSQTVLNYSILLRNMPESYYSGGSWVYLRQLEKFNRDVKISEATKNIAQSTLFAYLYLLKVRSNELTPIYGAENIISESLLQELMDKNSPDLQKKK